MGAGGGGEGGAHGMGKGGGFDSSGPAGLGADAFGGGDSNDDPLAAALNLTTPVASYQGLNWRDDISPWDALVNAVHNITPISPVNVPANPLNAPVNVGIGVINQLNKAKRKNNKNNQRQSERSIENPAGYSKMSYRSPPLPDQSVSYNTNAVSNVVSRSLKEAAARKKAAARVRAKAVVKEAARLKARETPKSAWEAVAELATPLPPLIIDDPAPPATPLPPLVIDDPAPPVTKPLTDHQFNVRIREQTKARLARAREKTKAHYANLREKGVSTKTIKLAQSKAKARYAKIKAQGKAKYR